MTAVTGLMATVATRDWNDHMDGGGWMWVLMVLFWVVGIGVIVWLVTRGGHAHHVHHPDGTRSARQILDERYARGEIDTDDYQERVEKLR